MSAADGYIKDPAGFWKWFVGALSQVPDPNERGAEFLFGIGEETWERYKGYAIDALNPKSSTKLTLPQGKHLLKVVMSRAFELMSPDDQRTLIRIWCHIGLESAGKGNPPSEDLIEFIGFIMRKCSGNLLQKGIRTVRDLPY